MEPIGSERRPISGAVESSQLPIACDWGPSAQAKGGGERHEFIHPTIHPTLWEGKGGGGML